MAEIITVEVGDLYADVHEQMCDSLGDQYDQRMRAEMEEFIHNMNQQVERQVEQASSEQPDVDLDGESDDE